jgi:glycosyltransferase involved in cell wall biosynthesis
VKRLLLLAERFPPDIGGVATSAGRIARAIAQLGVEVDIVTWSRYLQPGEVLPTPPEEMPQVYRIGLYRHWDMTMPSTLNFLEWLHQSRQYDAIWGHYLFPSGFLATWFGKMQGIPCVVSARGNDIDKEIFPPGDFARLKWTLETADLVTAVSQDLAKKIELLCGRKDVAVIYNAVNPEVFTFRSSEDAKIISDRKTALGIHPDEAVLGFAGELREKKGQQFLLEALTKVREKHPACLLIIGEVRASQEGILQAYKLQNPDCASRVIITGHLPDPQAVAQHLHLCDVYLQPSLWEGLPNALLEAMACGCGCIASDAGGIPEIVTHGKNGFILSRSLLNRLGDAVLEYLELTKESKQKIAIAARDRISTAFSPNREQSYLQEVLNQLLPCYFVSNE